jgi:hypothetical protein
MTVEFAFGDTDGGHPGALATGLPLLAGADREWIAGAMEPAAPAGGLALWTGAGRLFGYARSAAGAPLEAETRRIYDGLLAAAAGRHLYRIWNLVPDINGDGGAGLENYQAFCRGRAEAFEAALGGGYGRRLPAASALGTTEARLLVAFLAGPVPGRHVENPAQVPAYEYPREHGPKPPSFARATVVDRGERRDAFVSGTSAITGHETVAPSDTLGQLACTLENLRLISGVCGIGERLGAGACESRHFKVYLRHPADLAAVRPALEAALLQAGDHVSYLGADICRSALNVEIEVAVRGAARS